MRVYLPEYEPGWRFFDNYVTSPGYGPTDERGVFVHDEKLYKGGQYIVVPVESYRIPVFRKADHTVRCAPMAVELVHRVELRQ